MAWRQKPKYSRTDPTAPAAWATDDRSGFITNLNNMRWQLDWRGLSLQNTRVFSFDKFLDEPQRQLGSIILPPDPVGVANARVEQYPGDESWPRLLQNGAPRYLQTPTVQSTVPNQPQARQLQYSKYFT